MTPLRFGSGVYVDPRPAVKLTFSAPGMEPIVTVVRSAVELHENCSSKLTKEQILALAKKYNLKVGKNKKLKDIHHVVKSCMQLAYCKALKKESKQMEEAHDVRVETLAEDNVPTDEAKQPKERKRKTFKFREPREEKYAKVMNKKKGQAKLVLGILREDPEKIWTVETLSQAIEAHPELKTKSEALKIANYYVWDLRNNCDAIEML